MVHEFGKKMRWHDMQSPSVRQLSNEYGANTVMQMVLSGVPESDLEDYLQSERDNRQRDLLKIRVRIAG